MTANPTGSSDGNSPHMVSLRNAPTPVTHTEDRARDTTWTYGLAVLVGGKTL